MSQKLGAICYTGNKQKLINDLLPLFPEYERFVDVCCGGLSVSLNVEGPVLANDVQTELIDMYESMRNYTTKDIRALCAKYGLSKANQDSYYALREEYNKTKEPILLLLLQYGSFSNMIRFQNGQFNAPFGRREMNSRSTKKLEHFHENVQKIEFSNCTFEDLVIKDGDFVYIDPPYLITEAAYNALWSEELEHKLYSWLDKLDSRGIKFGLSNVLFHRSKENKILQEWREKYDTHYLDKKYVFNAYHAKEQESKTVEVYITNYEKSSAVKRKDI